MPMSANNIPNVFSVGTEWVKLPPQYFIHSGNNMEKKKVGLF
jgi:hypothetical protein